MNQKLMSWWSPALGVVLALTAWATASSAQQHVILDKPVRAGELTLYPSLDDANVYYYLPDKIRVATDENGNPDFSFIRYVQNVRSGADQGEAKQGQGGGIVHASVMMSVSQEQLQDALRALQSQKPGARIEGPIAYKAGRFSLISAFADGKGGNSTQVLGLGSAPLLDNQKAAVSIELTKDGAIKLWESFNLANPSIDFKFEMDAAGYSSPIRAVIDADWSKIYNHKAFGAGVATSFLAAEVKSTFDELRTQDAIKITQVGQDEKMDQVVAVAYQMIKDRMFEPFGGTGQPSLTDLTSIGQNQPSLLDRATARFKEAQADVRAVNADIRKDNDQIRARNDKALAERGGAARTKSRAESADRRAMEAEARVALLENRVKVAERQAANPPNLQGLSTDSVLVAVAARAATEARQETANLQKELAAAKTEATKLRQDADKAGVEEAGGLAHQTEALKEEKTAPPISIIATLEMKKVKQSGTFHFDMNKYMPDNRSFPFTQGIGDLSRLKSDPRYFRQINMDDPLYRQREIVAMVDGVNAQDFGQFVNFVDVQMRKKHAGGDVTDDEVRVDRNNFNKEGNNFKLLYGWKGDEDRSKWMEYEVQATWSLFGGRSVVDPWRKSTNGAINLSPPYRRRTITIDGTAETLQAADVRAVTVQLFYDVGGAEQTKSVTLNVAKGLAGEKLEILTPPNSTNYAYQMTWQLKGNKTLSTPRQTAATDLLFVDDLPQTQVGSAR